MLKSKSGDPRLRNHKRPKQCAKGFYHLGSILLFAGLIVAIIGMLSNNLFEIIVYDNRHPPVFQHVVIHVGLFLITGEIQVRSNEQTDLEYPLVLKESRWVIAKVMAAMGIGFGIFALLMHLIFLISSCIHRHRDGGAPKPWCLLFIETLCLLTAVISLLVGLSLAECEMEAVHNAGDEALTMMLQQNGMLAKSVELDRSLVTLEENLRGSSTLEEAGSLKASSAAEFDLVLSSPRYSFYVLIAADFLLLLGFLANLVHFVRVSKKVDNLRKQLRSAHTAQPSMT